MTSLKKFLEVVTKEEEATVYQKHKSLPIREKTYRDWHLPGAVRLCDGAMASKLSRSKRRL